MKQFNKNQKGFTLVEIIVVLVILAILAAALVPAMTGFIDEAKGKAYITEARTAYTAAQAQVTEKVAGGATFATISSNITGSKLDVSTNPLYSMMKDSITAGAQITALYPAAGSTSKIGQIVYVVAGKTITITSVAGTYNSKAATVGSVIE